MPSTYSDLKIQLLATGENATTWGDVTNVNLGTALEEAIVGSANVAFSSGNVTLTLADTNSTQTARHLRLRCTGTTGGARNLVVPAIQKLYLVVNECADAITVKNATGTGVAVPAGASMWVYNDATNVTNAVTHLSSLTLTTALAVGSGGTGANTFTSNGVVYGNTTSPLTATAAGVNGQVLVGNTGAAPSWGAIGSIAVNTFSGGTTGLTPSSPTAGAISLAGTLVVANGGTGATSFTAGRVLVGNSTGALVSANILSVNNTNSFVGINIAAPTSELCVDGLVRVRAGTAGAPSVSFISNPVTGMFSPSANIVAWATGSSERMRVDSSGSVLIGTTTNGSDVSRASISNSNDLEYSFGTLVLVNSSNASSVRFFNGADAGYSVSGAVMLINRNSGTTRSINAAGTINASGADYAEYMMKADGCGIIYKGDVCGVDVEGKLVTVWSLARSFVVKSTNPAYVGGDTWDKDVSPRPQPGSDAYSAWEEEHEQARAKVDRIAFCGQTPVKVTGSFSVGDYIIAEQGPDNSIIAIAAPYAYISFDQYKRRLGRVWNTLADGKAWIDVQHG